MYTLFDNIKRCPLLQGINSMTSILLEILHSLKRSFKETFISTVYSTFICEVIIKIWCISQCWMIFSSKNNCFIMYTFSSGSSHVRKFPVTRSHGFLHYYQLSSHAMTVYDIEGDNVTITWPNNRAINEIQNSKSLFHFTQERCVVMTPHGYAVKPQRCKQFPIRANAFTLEGFTSQRSFHNVFGKMVLGNYVHNRSSQIQVLIYCIVLCCKQEKLQSFIFFNTYIKHTLQGNQLMVTAYQKTKH